MGKAAKQVLIDLGIEPEDPIENWFETHWDKIQ
jgi:hypothetical protein